MNEKLKRGDYNWKELDYDAHNAFVGEDLTEIAVFSGDHPNLIISDANFLAVPEGFKLVAPLPPEEEISADDADV